MAFGANPRNDYERVNKSVADNSWKDTATSFHTLVGQDEKVMNLRPVNKSLHIDNQQGFFKLKDHTQTERLHDIMLSRKLNHLDFDDIGLAAHNPNELKLRKTMREVIKQNYKPENKFNLYNKLTMSRTEFQRNSIQLDSLTTMQDKNLDFTKIVQKFGE